MSVTKITAKWVYHCDGCTAAVEQTSQTRPRNWVDLHFIQDAYDYQGMAVADGSVKRVLCGECARLAREAINEALSRRALADKDTLRETEDR